MYYSYIEIEYVATSFSPARTDLALKLLNTHVANIDSYYVGFLIILTSYVCRILGMYQVITKVCRLYWFLMSTFFQYWIPMYAE
jgi:hypothetical protein